MNVLQSIWNALPFISKKQPEILNKNAHELLKQQLYLSQNDLQDWKYAIQAAESMTNPNRYQLQKIYKSIDWDAQLVSLVASRKIKSLGKDYRIVNKKKKEQEDLTKLLQSSWFREILSLSWDSIMYGHSLIQLGDLDNNSFNDIQLVPRQYVLPDKCLILEAPGMQEGVSYMEGDAAEWTISVGGKNNLGLFAKLAPWVLLKQHAVLAEAQMVELYGVPIRIAKMDTSDPLRVQSMFNMLGSMGSKGYGVIDAGVDLEIVQPPSGGSNNVQESFIRYLDEQISKVIFGQTMMSDDGSSRSQSETHERLANAYVKMDMMFLTSVINDVVIPKLINLGFVQFKNCTFEFYDVENKEERFEQALKLINAKVPVDLKWMEETFGIPIVKGAEVVQEPTVDINTNED